MRFLKASSEAPAEEDSKQTNKHSMTSVGNPQAHSPVDIYTMSNICNPEGQANVGKAVQELLNGQANGTKRRVAGQISGKPVPVVMAAQHTVQLSGKNVAQQRGKCMHWNLGL